MSRPQTADVAWLVKDAVVRGCPHRR